jgi:F0F1-type ATP synthase assembly protein I
MKSQPNSRPGDVAKSTRDLYRAVSMSSVGIELALAVLIGLFAGMYADKKLHTGGPWLMIVGLVLGIVAGAKGIHRVVKEADRHAAEGQS